MRKTLTLIALLAAALACQGCVVGAVAGAAVGVAGAAVSVTGAAVKAVVP